MFVQSDCLSYAVRIGSENCFLTQDRSSLPIWLEQHAVFILCDIHCTPSCAHHCYSRLSVRWAVVMTTVPWIVMKPIVPAYLYYALQSSWYSYDICTTHCKVPGIPMISILHVAKFLVFLWYLYYTLQSSWYSYDICTTRCKVPGIPMISVLHAAKFLVFLWYLYYKLKVHGIPMISVLQTAMFPVFLWYLYYKLQSSRYSYDIYTTS